MREFLNMTSPSTIRSTLTKHMQRNLADYERTIREDIRTGKLEPGPIVVFPIDRAKGKVYQQRYTTDAVPTLTTSNKYLFLMSTVDIDLADDNRELFRWLLPAERLPPQGFSPPIALHMPAGKIYKLAGNAYPVPLLGTVLGPLVGVIARSG